MEEFHSLSTNQKDPSSPCVFNLWFPLVQIQSPEFKLRSNSPLVRNGYPLSGGNI